MTDPTNLKTLAQFLLLGDPSTTPCLRAHDFLPTGEELEVRDVTAQRKARRVALAPMGNSISHGKAVPGALSEIDKSVTERIRAIGEQKGYAGSKMAVFSIKGPPSYRLAMKARGAEEHVVVLSRTVEAPPQIIAIRHLVAHIVGDAIAKIAETVSR